MGTAGADPICRVSWGPTLLSSQKSEQNPEGRKILEGAGRHICFGDGLFFVCLLLWETRKEDQARLFIAQLLSANL